MKAKHASSLLALALGLSAFTSTAQDAPGQQRRPGGPPDGQDRGPGVPPDGQRRGFGGPPDGQGRGFGGPQDGQGRGFGGAGFRPPTHPVMAALDANNDGIIDEAEMKNAYAALKKLDKDGDGRLSEEETRPQFGRGGGFGGPGQGGPGGRPDGGRPEGGFGGQRGPGDFGGPRPDGAGDRGPGFGGGDFIARIMENDKNKDGKLSKDELPERMQGMFERLDGNGDGFVDKAELDSMAQRSQRGGQPGGDQPGRRGPGGDRPGQPQRPPLEQ